MPGGGAKRTTVGVAASVSTIRGSTSGAAVRRREWLVAYSQLCQPTWPQLRSDEEGERLTVGVFNFIGPRGRGGRCSRLATIREMRIANSEYSHRACAKAGMEGKLTGSRAQKLSQ